MSDPAPPSKPPLAKAVRPSARSSAPASVRRHAILAAATLALAGCKLGVLDPRGPVGAAENTILFDSLAVMLTIVVPTIAATLAFAWWFRASNPRAQYRPDWAYSGRIEGVVWSIPILVVIFLGGIAWVGSHDLEPSKPLMSSTRPLDVQVVSLDWKWLFIYPAQGIATVNQITVPAGTPIHFTLTSASVMNAFFIPQLGSMIYTMNGMTTQLNLQADQPGQYAGRSSHYSGDGFSKMQFQLTAVPQPAFDAWVQQVRAGAATLDAASYADLARQSIGVAPAAYHAIDPTLFGKIATQAIPQAAGPDPNAGVHPTTEPHHAG